MYTHTKSSSSGRGSHHNSAYGRGGRESRGSNRSSYYGDDKEVEYEDEAQRYYNEESKRSYENSIVDADDITVDFEHPVGNHHHPSRHVEEEQEFEPSSYNDKYRHERNAINDAQSVAYTAYTMTQEKAEDIVQQLRNVGVTVLSLESLSTAAMINYMDAVTTMRLGSENIEKCMLYTDRMGRVFNVIISGGAEGLAKTWSITQSAFSGWIAITALPFLARNIVSFSFNGYATGKEMTFDPAFLLFIFGFVLSNETSHSMLAVNLLVRGTNSVGSYVWRSGSLTDYPRMMLLIILSLASFAPNTSPIRDILTLIGTIFGCFLLFCNLGSRAWKKVDIGFIDASNFFTPFLSILASLCAGIAFPYVGLRSVDGGTDDEDGETAVEKIIFNPNGKRARQNVTAAATIVAVFFLLSDVQAVKDVLGYDFSNYSWLVNIGMGTWWLLSTLMSMALCHRLDSSKSKKIEPFLKRDERSPVGWIVPSVPNIVIDPNLGRGKMCFSFLSYGSDFICALIAAGLASLIIFTGILDLQGKTRSSFWDWS
mmetsp:Transcript_20830/g.25625  ORF Transcript_20830/g.25625 Transcript_20830/m.25625 type:complete len:540 (-) Transcript_20830:54-1673(-)